MAFGTNESFALRIERRRKVAALQKIAAAKREKAAPRARERAAPTRAHFEPTDLEIPRLDDLDLAAKVIRAGQMSRGELPIPAPPMTEFAAAVIAAADLARAGGPQRPEPTGLAAAIIAVGAKRRQPRGS